MGYFTFEYLEKNRNEFENFSEEDFINNYKVNQDLVEEFINYARLNESDSDFTSYNGQLKKVLKASIAQQLFGSNAFEAILNKDDAMIKKVKTLENQEKDE